MAEKIGFIGLGAMGGPMAKNLVKAGFELVVFDPSPTAQAALTDAGATAASSAKDVADQAPCVMVSLPTPDVVKAVALGEGGVCEGAAVQTFVDLSTTGPRVAADIAAGLAAHDIAQLDSPVSGGVGGAEKATLAVMVSGPQAHWERYEPALKAIGKPFFIGEEAGQGQMMKLLNNYLSATAMVATAEAFVAGAKAGLDPDVMVDVICAGSGMNTAVRDKFPKSVLPRTFDYGFRTELMYKDVKLCLEEAEAMGVPMWVGQPVKQWWSYSLARGGVEEDFTNVIRYMEENAGIEVRSRRNAPND